MKKRRKSSSLGTDGTASCNPTLPTSEKYPNSSRAFFEQSKEASVTFYITLVSIIQSLAFSFLIEKVTESFVDPMGLSLITLLQSSVALVMIIHVWHEYAVGTIAYKWPVDLFDSSIPFAMGVFEYFMIAMIFLPAGTTVYGLDGFSLWLCALAGFAITGILAYANQAKKASYYMDNASFLNMPRRSAIHAFGFLVFFALAALVSVRWQLALWIRTTIATATLLGFAMELFRVARFYSAAAAIQTDSVGTHG